MLEEAFWVDMDKLPFHLNISMNSMVDYQEVQVCQVRGIDLVEVMNNRVDVSDNYGAVLHLNALVSSQNIGMGSVNTSFLQAFWVDMEKLPFPLNISMNNMVDYQEVQVCQVRRRDLVEVLDNMVDVSDN